MQRRVNSSITAKAAQGRVGYLLILVAIAQLAYPITAGGDTWAIILYQAIYASLVVVGVLLAGESTTLRTALIILAVASLTGGSIYAFNSQARWALFLGYVCVIPFKALLLEILLRFIFTARIVTRDVLFAAVAAYLLLGGVFVPVYGLLETLIPGSFADDAAPEAPVYWQQFVYYSYATLTTLGYGDITPQGMWARSLASLQAVLGVMYVTVVMARLVGMYAKEPQER